MLQTARSAYGHTGGGQLQVPGQPYLRVLPSLELETFERIFCLSIRQGLG